MMTQSTQKNRNDEGKKAIMYMIFNQHNICHINSSGGNGFNILYCLMKSLYFMCILVLAVLFS